MRSIMAYGDFCLNESSLKKLKKRLQGSLGMKDRARMKKELRNNIITFKFKKRNGDIRTAHGTLHPDYLPPLRGGSPRPEHQMVYFDLDKDGWRSFRSYKFIKILNIKPVVEDEIDDEKLDKKIDLDRRKAKSKKEKEERVKKIHSEEAAEKSKIFKKVKGEDEDDKDEDIIDSVKHHEEKVHKKEEKHKEKSEHKEKHGDEHKEKPKKEKDVVERIHEDDEERDEKKFKDVEITDKDKEENKKDKEEGEKIHKKHHSDEEKKDED